MPFNPSISCYLLYLSAWLISVPFPAADQALLLASKTAPPGMGTVFAIGKARLPESVPPETALPGFPSGYGLALFIAFSYSSVFLFSLYSLFLLIKTNAAG